MFGTTNRSSVFGQKPEFGFGPTPTQSSLFGSTTQQSQPASGNGIFGSSTPFGSTQSGFGSGTPAFGATSTPAFGSMSTPAFGSTGSPAFGSTGTAFGASNAPAFGTGGTFGASSTPAFGTSSTPVFGASSSAFGGSSTPAFGASSTPSFSFGSSPAFGQSTPAFGSSPFGITTFRAQSSFGIQSSAPAFESTSFGQSPFGGQHGGSRVAPYTPTTEADSGSGTQPAAKLESILAMPVYKDKSHEELRWEDYQLGNKGIQSSAPTFGSTSFGQSPFGGQRGGSRVSPYTPTTEADSGSGTEPAAKLESISTMPVYKDKSHEELRWEDYQLGDKGGPQPAAPPSGGIDFGVSMAPTSAFVSSSTFGQTSANPFSSTMFGASSSPAFGSCMPAFGSSSSSFGGSSLFGQKPAFGFGYTPTESSPFGSTTQQSQPAFGSGIFGSSTPFGSTQSGFGSSTPAFGTTSTPAFGATSTPAFGATSTPAFGSTGSPAFGSTGTAFGVSNAPAFGTGGSFGAFSTPAFGTSSTPAFGASSSTPAFGASFTPFSFGSSPALGQSTPAFGSSPFGTTTFGAQSSFGTRSSALAFGSTSFGQSPFGGQRGGSRVVPYTPTTEADSESGTQPVAKLESISVMPVYKDKSHEELRWEDYQLGDKGIQSSAPAFGSTSFGQSPFGGQHGGSRVAPYTPTTEADSGSGTLPAAKLESISAMPVYKDKSHEELRWEDYQLGDKDGPQPAAQPSGGIDFGVSTAPTSPFVSSSTFGQISANPFSSTSTYPLSLKPTSLNSTSFTTLTTTSNPFPSTSSSLFGPTSSTTSIFSSSATPTFGTCSSLFSLSVTLSFPISPSIFGTDAALATTSAFATGLNFSSSQTTPLFNSTPAIGQTGNVFGQVTSTFGQSTSNFGQTSIFNTASTGFSGNMFSSSLLVAPSSNPAAFGPTTLSFASPFQPAQTSGAFSFNNLGQTQSGGASGIFGQSNIGLPSATQSAAAVQPVTITNPHGTLPAMPPMSIGRVETAESVQYGILFLRLQG